MRAWGRAVLSVAVVLGVLVVGVPMVSATPTPIVTPGVVRLAGGDRFETAAAISKATWAPPVPVVYVATGLNFPDALAGGPVAARAGGPVLPVLPTAIPAVIATELTRLDPARIVILGGTGAVNATVQTALAAYAPSVSRVAGADRYDTAARTATSGFTAPVPVAYVATGTGFADALAGGAAAAHQGGPVLLTTPTMLPAPTQAALAALRPRQIVIVGGSGVVSGAVQTALAAYTTGTVTRLGGVDRYDTARVIAQQVFGASESIVLATGSNFPDALAGVPTAFVNAAPLLLTGPYCAAWPTHVAWVTLGASRSITLGGTAVVSDKAARLIGCIQRLAPGGGAAVSADGRHVAFTSLASNLVPGDTNHHRDVFVTDALTGTITRVSTDSAGGQADIFPPEVLEMNETAAISADGRYVAFDSDASDLVPGDTNAAWDVFVKDTRTGTTTRVSTATDGSQADQCPPMSGGWCVSTGPSISGTGRYVAFNSHASDLVPGDTNGRTDVFIKDRTTGETTRVSTDSSGVQAYLDSYDAAVSADGRYVVFHFGAGGLYRKDRLTGQTVQVGPESQAAPAVSADGDVVAFTLMRNAPNNPNDVYVTEISLGTMTRVSTSSSGAQANGDCLAPTPSLPEVTISADGRYVSFFCIASNLVPGDTNNAYDVFIKDRQTGITTRVSVTASGAQATGGSYSPALSADGRYVAFPSNARNLVPGLSLDGPDLFLVQVR